MPQINFHTTPQFDADLAALTEALKLRSKSEAIRLAVHEFAAALRENAARKAAKSLSTEPPLHPSTSSG